ncbi:hypothetical protein PIB30_061892, partial [Stylosanthes scabra]|nr:hypothetical protein [Stylosanthes scabra]
MELGHLDPISGTDAPNSGGWNVCAYRVDCLSRTRVLSLLYCKDWARRSFWISFWDTNRLQGSIV